MREVWTVILIIIIIVILCLIIGWGAGCKFKQSGETFYRKGSVWCGPGFYSRASASNPFQKNLTRRDIVLSIKSVKRDIVKLGLRWKDLNCDGKLMAQGDESYQGTIGLDGKAYLTRTNGNGSEAYAVIQPIRPNKIRFMSNDIQINPQTGDKVSLVAELKEYEQYYKGGKGCKKGRGKRPQNYDY